MGKRRPSYPLKPARWGYKVIPMHADDISLVENSQLALQVMARDTASTVYIDSPAICMVGYPDGTTRPFVKRGN